MKLGLSNSVIWSQLRHIYAALFHEQLIDYSFSVEHSFTAIIE